MNPPPLPQKKKKKNNLVLWIVLGAMGLFIVGGAGIVAAILIPAVAKVRETAGRAADATNVRMILQSGLIWANVHDGNLPPVHLGPDGDPSETELATVHAVAAALARGGGLNEIAPWLSRLDGARSGEIPSAPIFEQLNRGVNPVFSREEVLAWDFATGLTTSLPATTPVAWTRGLQTDGTWSEGGVYGTDGGHITFLGGNVQFFADLRSSPLLAPDGAATSNILEMLPAGARIVGSGPGTLHGETGTAKPE